LRDGSDQSDDDDESYRRRIQRTFGGAVEDTDRRSRGDDTGPVSYLFII
jgi:hypothetical protein